MKRTVFPCIHRKYLVFVVLITLLRSRGAVHTCVTVAVGSS